MLRWPHTSGDVSHLPCTCGTYYYTSTAQNVGHRVTQCLVPVIGVLLFVGYQSVGSSKCYLNDSSNTDSPPFDPCLSVVTSCFAMESYNSLTRLLGADVLNAEFDSGISNGELSGECISRYKYELYSLRTYIVIKITSIEKLCNAFCMI